MSDCHTGFHEAYLNECLNHNQEIPIQYSRNKCCELTAAGLIYKSNNSRST